MITRVTTSRANQIPSAYMATKRSEPILTLVRLISALTYADRFSCTNVDTIVIGNDPFLCYLIAYFAIGRGDVYFLKSDVFLETSNRATYTTLRDIVTEEVLDLLPLELSYAISEGGVDELKIVVTKKAVSLGRSILIPSNYNAFSSEKGFRGNENGVLFFLKHDSSSTKLRLSEYGTSNHVVRRKTINMLRARSAFIVSPCDSSHYPKAMDNVVDCNIDAVTVKGLQGSVSFAKVRELQVKAVINAFK